MHQRTLPYLLLAPAAIFLCLFFLYPFILVAVQAFSAGDRGFTLENFQTMADHWKFNVAFSNTMWLALIVVPAQLILSLLMATMVMKMQRGRDIFLYIWTIPLGISDLAAGLIWLSIFEQQGFLNSILFNLGLIETPTAHLSYQNWYTVFIAIALAEIWRATAIMLVILVAGMGLIPKEYYEAAEIFGASAWKRFTKVTLPMLRPSLQTALILRVILAFEVFAVVEALGGTTLPVLMGETYQWQFILQDNGVAAAYALVILAISIVFTLILLRVLRVPKGAQI